MWFAHSKAVPSRPQRLLTLWLGLIVLWPSLLPADDAGDFFEKRIRPILVDKCGECHTGKTPEGDFRIDSLAALKKGGMSGPGILPGKPDDSELIQRLESDDPDL
ncbi:MAG TPA: c-type cytochrome domain-containing protein, partial [Caulifigura sp.]|nr:c-type cytochrome domain-containing protein [Caulifigura sp.]